MPRLLHTADWQIGKPYRWVEEAHQRSRLQRARLDAIERVMALSDRHSVDVMVVAGDLFDSSTVEAAVVSTHNETGSVAQAGLLVSSAPMIPPSVTMTIAPVAEMS